MRRRVAVAAGLGALAVLVVLVVVLAQPVDQQTGSNTTQSVSNVRVAILAGNTRCQPVNVPAGTQAITVFATRAPGAGPLQIELRDGDGRVVARGRIGRFPRQTAYTFALRPGVTAEVPRDRLCFDNDGLRNVVLAGDRTLGPNPGPHPRRPRAVVRTDFSKAGKAARIELAGDVDRRLPLAKSAVLGLWTLWAVGLVFLVAAGTGVWLLLRESRA